MHLWHLFLPFLGWSPTSNINIISKNSFIIFNFTYDNKNINDILKIEIPCYLHFVMPVCFAANALNIWHFQNTLPSYAYHSCIEFVSAWIIDETKLKRIINLGIILSNDLNQFFLLYLKKIYRLECSTQ